MAKKEGLGWRCQDVFQFALKILLNRALRGIDPEVAIRFLGKCLNRHLASSSCPRTVMIISPKFVCSMKPESSSLSIRFFWSGRGICRPLFNCCKIRQSVLSRPATGLANSTPNVYCLNNPPDALHTQIIFLRHRRNKRCDERRFGFGDNCWITSCSRATQTFANWRTTIWVLLADLHR